MHFTPKFVGEVENGKLTLDDESSFRSYLSSLSGPVYLTVSKEDKSRTPKQNRFYWSFLKMISDDTGHTDDELHELFKQKFLQSQQKEILGNEVRVYQSTTKLTKQEFSDYIRKIEELTGILAPDPNSVSVI